MEKNESLPQLFGDTHPDAERVQYEIMRNMPYWKKLQLMDELNKVAQTMMINGLRDRYPAAEEKEIKRRLFDMMLGEDLAEAVYGPIEAFLGHD